MNVKTMLCIAVFAVGLRPIAFAENDVVVRQRWPWSEIVDIDISVDTAGCDYDLVATWDGCPAGIQIGTIQSAHGEHHLAWDPRARGLASKTLNNFKVSLKPVNVASRLFMAIWLTNTVDIVDKAGGSYQAGDITYYSSLPARNDTVDMRRLLFRRVRAYDDNGRQIVYTNGYEDAILDLPIPNGATAMTLRERGGVPFRTVKFSSDYWIMTMPLQASAAWKTCMNFVNHGTKSFQNNYGCNIMTCSGNDLRGTAEEGVAWPDKGFTVAKTSYVGQTREWLKKKGVFAKFGNDMIVDVPTMAQWETAARAGTDGKQIFAPNSGAVGYGPITANSTPADVTNTLGNAWVDASQQKHEVTRGMSIWYFNRLARGHMENGQWTRNSNVGRLDPNAWGLFDMPGIEKEWALGCYDTSSLVPFSGEDPVCAPAGATQYRAFGGTQTESGEGAIRYVPGVAWNFPFSNGAMARLVINTRNWLAK